MSKRHLYLLAGALVLLGLGTFLYKAFVLDFPLVPDTQSDSWDIEVRAAFKAYNVPVKLSLYVPRSNNQYAILDENFISRGYGLTAKRSESNRQVVWSIRQARGEQALYYRAMVRRGSGDYPRQEAATVTVTPPDMDEAHRAAADALIADIRAHSADVETFTSELLKRLNRPAGDENIALFLGRESKPLTRLRAAVQILARAGIAARIVNGIRLQELQRNIPLVHWLEVVDKGYWHPFDPATGQATVPHDYFAWWKGDEPFALIKGARGLTTQTSVRLVKESALTSAMMRGRLSLPGLVDYSLLSLPIETQAVYQVMLLVPLGAFLLVVLRNVVGVKTFGTFMPVLIALAFRETQLVWGVILFSLVVAMGLAVRFYFDRLKLLLVPRLAAVLIVVVLLMAFISVVSFKLGIEKGLSIALFPMIIMTMTIERMSIVWEERGPLEAIQQGLGSLLVAGLAYLVMSFDYARHLAFVFPELLLVLLAATLLLGRYSGYRLTELMRFRVLADR